MIPLDDVEAVRLLKNRGAVVTELKKLWIETMPEITPPEHSIFLSWLFCNPLGAVAAAIGETSRKARSLDGTMSAEHALRFVQSVLTSYRKGKLHTVPQCPQLPDKCFAEITA
jgi:hypothetical protein